MHFLATNYGWIIGGQPPAKLMAVHISTIMCMWLRPSLSLSLSLYLNCKLKYCWKIKLNCKFLGVLVLNVQNNARIISVTHDVISLVLTT